MSQYSFQTIVDVNEAEFKDKGSRFLAFAYPVRNEIEIKQHIDALRQIHHKARHWCYAYRLGTDGNRFRANDDGEPAGSAGRPILGQIDSFALTDILVVVVRYFGGTLLGVSGLIHAYKTATILVLQSARIIEKSIDKLIFLRCDYPHLHEALRIAKQFQVEIISQDLQLDCRLQARVALAQYEACLAAWKNTRVIEISE